MPVTHRVADSATRIIGATELLTVATGKDECGEMEILENSTEGRPLRLSVFHEPCTDVVNV